MLSCFLCALQFAMSGSTRCQPCMLGVCMLKRYICLTGCTCARCPCRPGAAHRQRGRAEQPAGPDAHVARHGRPHRRRQVPVSFWGAQLLGGSGTSSGGTGVSLALGYPPSTHQQDAVLPDGTPDAFAVDPFEINLHLPSQVWSAACILSMRHAFGPIGSHPGRKADSVGFTLLCTVAL